MSDKAKGPGPRAITLQDNQVSRPAQGIVRLMQVQLELEGSGPCTVTSQKSVEEVMVGDGSREAAMYPTCIYISVVDFGVIPNECLVFLNVL